MASIIILLGCGYLEPNLRRGFESNIDSEKAADIYAQGDTYFKQKNYAKAIGEFEKIIDDYPNSDAYEPALYLTAFSYFKLNNLDVAAALGERFIKEFPNSTYFLNAISLLGESFYRLAEDYRAAYYLTKFYTQSKDTTGRKAAFEHIFAILPNLSISQLEKLHRIFMADAIDEHILFNLAQIEAREGKKREAERDFNLLTRRFPETAYTYEVEEYKRSIGLGETTKRVGVLLSLTGSYANYGQKLLDVVKTFQRDKDLPFSLYLVDTKSDPLEAMKQLEKLINQVKVDFLIAPIRIYEAFGICGLASGKGIPVILPLTTETRFESIPQVFTSSQSGEEQARVIADYSMQELGLAKFLILYPNLDKYKSIADAFANEIMKNNRELIAMVNFDPDSITLKNALEGLKDKAPQAIFLAMDTDMLINTAPQIAYYGLEKIRLLGIESFHDEKVARLGEKYVEGAIFVAGQIIDSLALKALKKEGYEGDEMTAKFFQVLWQLKALKEYDRTNLVDLISKMLKGQQVYDIYQIKGYEFIKLSEISKQARE